MKIIAASLLTLLSSSVFADEIAPQYVVTDVHCVSGKTVSSKIMSVGTLFKGADLKDMVKLRIPEMNVSAVGNYAILSMPVDGANDGACPNNGKATIVVVSLSKI